MFPERNCSPKDGRKSILGTSAIILTRRIRSQIGLFPFSDYEGRLWGRDPAKISHKEYSLLLLSRFNLRRIFIWLGKQGVPWSPSGYDSGLSLLRPGQGTEIPWAEQHSQKKGKKEMQSKIAGKDAQHHCLLEKRKSKPHWGITLYPSERPSLTNLRTINAREGWRTGGSPALLVGI